MTEDPNHLPPAIWTKPKPYSMHLKRFQTPDKPRSGQSAREAPMPAPKSPSVRETPTVGIALSVEGVMPHQEGVQSVREAPVDINHKTVHEVQKIWGMRELLL